MFINTAIRRNNKARRVPGIAPGEMYKRYTFGSRPFTPESFRGLVKTIEIAKYLPYGQVLTSENEVQ